LHRLARKAIELTGKTIAPDLMAQRLFRQVVQEVAQPVDALGTARAWWPGAKSLLKSGPNLDAATSASGQTAQLFEVAKVYQRTLGERGLIDGSDLYWHAAQSKASPQKVLIYGYFQPRPDELAWINALAAEDSVLFLPVADSPLFADSQVAVDWLVAQGWQVVGEAGAQSQDTGQDSGIAAQAVRNAENIALGESLSQRFCGAKDRFSSDKQGQGLHRAQTPHRSESAIAYAYSTLEAEVRGTLAKVKALLNNGTPARDIAIIARDEVAYGPRLIDIAWEYGVPLRALYQTPLLTTRLGAWLNLLVEVIDTKFPFEGTARLLSHPLASNPDRDFWAAARRQHPQGFAAWEKLAQEQLELNLDLLAQIRQSHSREDWVDLWQRILGRFDLRRRCARWARESLAFNTVNNALGELAKPETEVLTWGEFRQELRDLLDRLTVPAQPGRGGVELHSPRSVVGARYAHLFVVGMAEGILPAPISNDPLLDFFERQQLRQQGIVLPSAAEMARREALDTYFLLQTVTDSVVFSYAQLEGRQERLPSPYLKPLGLTLSEPPAPAIASPEEHRRAILRHHLQTRHLQTVAPQTVDLQGLEADDSVLPAAIHAYAVEQGRESHHPANEYDGVIGIPFDKADWPFSVSQLQNLGQCPFKWFANKLLKLGPPEDIDDDLSPSQIGQLYHRVLELVLAEGSEDPARSLADPERFSSLLNAAFSQAERDILPPNLPAWTLRREEHLRILALALQDPNFLPPGAMPVLLEQDFEGEWHGLKVRGRIDRIDRTETGLVLIDYKTGKSRPTGIKDHNGKACIDLQLPLYQEAAGPALFPHEDIAAAYYYSIRGRQKMALSSKASQGDLTAAIDRCKAHLATGHYPVQPDTDRKACAYCDFDALCRQGDRLSRKEMTHGID
jgi:ATP-dependent helicase/DNAse subunit B